MAIDLGGGLDPAHDHYLTRRPDDPEMRESVSVWISDDKGRFGFPRICLEAMAKSWQVHGIEVNLAFPDGRVLVGRGPAATHPGSGGDVFGAGPLTFETTAAFHGLRVSFDGEMVEGSVADLARSSPLPTHRQVSFRIECDMVVPPFVPGTMSEDARRRMAEGGDAAAMGGARYEQLLRCRGLLSVAGEDDWTFTGTGLRVHRVGVRDTSTMTGHCWQSAVFPSGRAFGYIRFPDQQDGSPGYNEGFVFDGVRMIPARAVVSPWLNEFVPNGGPCDCVIETEDGQRIRIQGVTTDSVCVPQGVSMFGDWPHNGVAQRFYHQGGARYRWNEEESFGMIERSLPQDKIQFHVG